MDFPGSGRLLPEPELRFLVRHDLVAAFERFFNVPDELAGGIGMKSPVTMASWRLPVSTSNPNVKKSVSRSNMMSSPMVMKSQLCRGMLVSMTIRRENSVFLSTILRIILFMAILTATYAPMQEKLNATGR